MEYRGVEGGEGVGGLGLRYGWWWIGGGGWVVVGLGVRGWGWRRVGAVGGVGERCKPSALEYLLSAMNLSLSGS